MSNHTYRSIEIIPLEERGIKKSLLKHAEENELPFIIWSNKNNLVEEHKDKWEIQLIQSHSEHRKGGCIRGANFHESITDLFPFLDDARVTFYYSYEGTGKERRTIFDVKDGVAGEGEEIWLEAGWHVEEVYIPKSIQADREGVEEDIISPW